MLSEKERRSRWLLLNICLLGGALLTFIGIRYFLVPHAAARTFGVPGRPTGFELHYILGLRNVWLGLLAVALALMREWRALALWFAGATVVCFSDAWIASRSLGGLPAITFHVASGAISLVLGILCLRTARRAAKAAVMPE